MLAIKIFPDGLFASLLRLWGHLRPRRRKQFILLLGFMLISAIAEVVSLGAVIPFLAVIASPERVLDTPALAYISHVFKVSSGRQMLLPLTIIFSATALLAGAIRVVLLWLATRLTSASGSELSSEVYRRTLSQPYQIHLSRNSSEVISGIINKVNAVVFCVIFPVLTLLASIFALIAITITLIFINPFVAFTAIIGFGVSYIAISTAYRRRLLRNSKRIADEQTRSVKALQEGLGGVRDMLLAGTQSLYCNLYEKADLPYRRAAGDNAFIGQSPRYTMEAIGMVLISSLAYFLSTQPGGVSTALPILGVLALGAQRLLPALHQIYNAWTSIVGNYSQLNDAIAFLDQPIPDDANLPLPEPLPIKDSISLRNIRFSYAGSSSLVLDGLNLNIPKGARIGIVGGTGSGKSTTLDILMGLLPLNTGEVLVDGKLIDKSNLRAWQRNIAHVPQSIFLSDASLAENIAFGVPLVDIDMVRVREAARQAQIADFIELRPEGYSAFVGERGVRLSGGQRQRIGIARALYRQANVLVFDEATSALDTATEQAVMDAVASIDHEITILIIAHRLTTLRKCDAIFELNKGQARKVLYEDISKSIQETFEMGAR